MKQGKTQKMDELVELYLKQMGLTRKYKEQEVYHIWEEVVGKMIAKYTKSLRVANGKIFVGFSSAVVKSEIALVKEGLLSALQDRLGKGVITDIVLI